MWAAISTRITRIIGVIGAILMALVFAYSKGRGDQAHKNEVRELKRYKEVRDEVDQVRPSPDRDAARERLRDNGLIR